MEMDDAISNNSRRVPIYIVSKGRADSRLTSRALESMGVPYYVVVEEQELATYAAVIDRKKLLVLNPAYQRDYETCDKLGSSKSKGPGPARNFAWDHSISMGAAWHWVMDDNIRRFSRMNRNIVVPVMSDSFFTCMEDFADRYTNVVMAGPNYEMFVWRKRQEHVFVANTRIYSCNLIRNDIPFRWRGRYNEDTDLSLRILKAGLCTIQFNAFLQCKMPTQTVKGGNTGAFYKHEGTRAKSIMQVRLHPDVSRVVSKFGRVHHHVDYSPFRGNKFILREDVAVADGVNEYGLVLATGAGAGAAATTHADRVGSPA